MTTRCVIIKSCESVDIERFPTRLDCFDPQEAWMLNIGSGSSKHEGVIESEVIECVRVMSDGLSIEIGVSKNCPEARLLYDALVSATSEIDSLNREAIELRGEIRRQLKARTEELEELNKEIKCRQELEDRISSLSLWQRIQILFGRSVMHVCRQNG